MCGAIPSIFKNHEREHKSNPTSSYVSSQTWTLAYTDKQNRIGRDDVPRKCGKVNIFDKTDTNKNNLNVYNLNYKINHRNCWGKNHILRMDEELVQKTIFK